MSNLPRFRLVELLRPEGGVLAIHAPAGWGKTALLEAAARSEVRLVPVPLGATEGHPSLFVEALSQGLRKAYPGSSIGAVRAALGLRGPEDPVQVFRKIREALGAEQLTIAFDEAERLPRGPVWDIVKKVAAANEPGLQVIVSARSPQPELVAKPDRTIGPTQLAFSVQEVEQLVLLELQQDLQTAQLSGRPLEARADALQVPGSPSLRALARKIEAETGGWPAIVAARVRASRALDVPRAELARAFSPIVDEAMTHERSEARYVLQVASVVKSFSRAMMQALVSGDVPGSPEARRRLIRLEPALIARSLDELLGVNLLLENPPTGPSTPGASETDNLSVPAGARLVLSERFRERDPAGWLEANRRAGELLITRDKSPGPELVDLFAASGERERLLDILSRHGPRLELELASLGDDDRLLGWVATLGQDASTPFWVDVLAGLAHARRGEVDASRARLDRARDLLAYEKRDNVLWRWQPRLAEAAAINARSRGDYVDARSFLQRGLDQVAQSGRRGLAQGEGQGELEALELRMTLMLARVCRESAGWEKVREVHQAARNLLTARLNALGDTHASRTARSRLETSLNEVDATSLALAFSAGDKAFLTDLAARAPSIRPLATVLADLLGTGELTMALDALRTLSRAPRTHRDANGRPLTDRSDRTDRGEQADLADLFLSRLSPSGDEAQAALDRLIESTDPLVEHLAVEVMLRRRRVPSSPEEHLEGWTLGLQQELVAGGPGRALDAARDVYRRVGARFDEVRLWLITAAAAARRVDDGDGEVEAVVKAVESLVEVAHAGGFAIPWTFAGRGESDPERRMRTLWIAGLRHGNERTRELCKAELERLGVDTRVVTGPRERPRTPSGLSRRPAIASGAPFVLHTRTSSQGLSGSDYQQIIASKGPGAFVVCVPDQIVLNFGRVVSLGQKRVMLPLLLHLLRNPDQCFSMLELAREVWDSPELTPTVQTKVKVAISRLRALLGKNRNYITTTRKQEGAESVVAYQVAAQLQFQIIEAAS